MSRYVEIEALTPLPNARVVTTIPNPEQPIATLNTGGGSLLADTYFYWLTALVGQEGVAVGETLAIGPVEIAAAAADSVTLEWEAVPGATLYRIYRATTLAHAPAEFFETDALTWEDDGTLVPVGVTELPGGNTTRLRSFEVISAHERVIVDLDDKQPYSLSKALIVDTNPFPTEPSEAETLRNQLGVQHARWEVAVDATADTYALTLNGQTAADIDFDATEAEFQAALVALSNVAAGDVAVTGGPGAAGGETPYQLDFGGALAATDVNITVDGTSLNVEEIQQLVVDASAGQFKLTFDAQQTADQAFDVSAASLQTALEALSNVAPGDITVTGGPGDAGGTTPYVLTFGGAYADLNVSEITTQAGTTPLSGGAATATVTTTTQGTGEPGTVVATELRAGRAGLL